MSSFEWLLLGGAVCDAPVAYSSRIDGLLLLL